MSPATDSTVIVGSHSGVSPLRRRIRNNLCHPNVGGSLERTSVIDNNDGEMFSTTTRLLVDTTSSDTDSRATFNEAWPSPLQSAYCVVDELTSYSCNSFGGGDISTTHAVLQPVAPPLPGIGHLMLDHSPSVTHNVNQLQQQQQQQQNGHYRWLANTASRPRDVKPTRTNCINQTTTTSFTDHVTKWLREQTCDSTVRRRRKVTKRQRAAANDRERRRMHLLNDAFDRLRMMIPVIPTTVSSNTGLEPRPLSRIQTLRLAIDYIALMTKTLDQQQPVEFGEMATTTTCTFSNCINNAGSKAVGQLDVVADSTQSSSKYVEHCDINSSYNLAKTEQPPMFIYDDLLTASVDRNFNVTQTRDVISYAIL